MSDVKRYDNWCLASHGHDMAESPTGSWVLASDYDARRAEIERLRGLLRSCADEFEEMRRHAIAKTLRAALAGEKT